MHLELSRCAVSVLEFDDGFHYSYMYDSLGSIESKNQLKNHHQIFYCGSCRMARVAAGQKNHIRAEAPPPIFARLRCDGA